MPVEAEKDEHSISRPPVELGYTLIRHGYTTSYATVSMAKMGLIATLSL